MEAATPSKRPRLATIAGPNDRFIPERRQLDKAVSSFELLSPQSSEEATPPPPAAQWPVGHVQREEYTRVLAASLSQEPARRVLSFGGSPRASAEQQEPPLLPLSKRSRAVAEVRPPFRACTSPDRILDAPNLVNDFYLHLLDWSAWDVVSVGLGDDVYQTHMLSGAIAKLPAAQPPGECVTSLKSSAESPGLLAVGMGVQLHIYDCAVGKRLRTMGGHGGRVGVLAWNGPVLSSGCRDGSIVQHDVRQKESRVSKVRAHASECCGLEWSGSGQLLASGSNDNLVKVWDNRRSSPLHVFDKHRAAIKALSWCPWQRHLLASGGGTADCTLRFWNTGTGQLANQVNTGVQVSSLQWSIHGQELVTAHGYTDAKLVLWRYPRLTKLCELRGHGGRILHLARSPDGTTLLSAATDETLRFWRLFGKPGAPTASSARGTTLSSSPWSGAGIIR